MANKKEQPADMPEHQQQEDQVSRAAVTGAVDAWFKEVVHNSPLSRDTQVYNYLVEARTRLIDKLGRL